jgi:imidazolonepropionase-like amidohydrolase
VYIRFFITKIESFMQLGRFLLVLLFVCEVFTLKPFSQPNFATNGSYSKNSPHYVFTNATLHPTSGSSIEKGMLIVQNDKIIYAGVKTKLPENSIEIDLKGKHIYPSFIELDADFGMAEAKKAGRGNTPQYETSKKGPYYWNEAVKPEVNTIDLFKYDSKGAADYRKKGFGTVLTHQHDGIVRGSSILVVLNDDEKESVVKNTVSSNYSFKKGTSNQQYPSSLMGSIALLRQFFYDAAYYKEFRKNLSVNLSLDAQLAKDELPSFFYVDEVLSILRANRIGDEFNKNFIYIGKGDEYQEIDELKKMNASVVIPLNFPKAYDVEDPMAAMYVTLRDLKHWELAPANPRFLTEAGISFAISSNQLDKETNFLNNLRLAVNMGLSKEVALDALTKTPASLIGVYDQVGSLEKGKIANFIITSDDIFTDKSIIYENWVQGNRHIVANMDLVDIRGEYNLNVNQIIRTLKVEGSIEKPKAYLTYDIITDSLTKTGDVVLDKVTGRPYKVTQKKKVDVAITAEKNFISLSYALTEGAYRLGGTINYDSGSWDGKGQLANGEWQDWTAIRKEKNKSKEDKTLIEKDSVALGKFRYPMQAYGWDSIPVQRPVLIKNATLWTCENEGKIQADLLIRNGKISAIAKILDVVDKNTLVIDAKGKHVTPGIIDEHSHIAIHKGVNEGSNAITSEVRIGDVISNYDINIYRQLSGGVTAVQLLHGSANPIGGQSALIKLRWGQTPESMKIDNADGYIKFALGENVKQSNWGSYNTIRFPQSRMGVEQVYYDAFIRAREYANKWKTYNETSGKKKEALTPPYRDLQLDALVEILEAKRFISCHSYVQSEINMLMHVADSMGFTVNTFTHILEGYKLADKMKEHGAGGSTFADWWAYKFEVNDAIPYNASLMHQMGIVTAINSDDAEMGRRLNQEAAKVMKYGGIQEEDALKLVTLNPARLLHLDDRMGSLKVGKDADLVIWSDNPLSIYAKAEKTIIDGIIYFDSERDLQMRKAIQEERLRIIHKMLVAKNEGAPTQRVVPKKQKGHVCTSIEEDDTEDSW